jgi:hypothetical protein
MGLLDDAIKEHLDLKRRRGADPAEIERAEREALGPVRRQPEPEADEQPGAAEEQPGAAEGMEAVDSEVPPTPAALEEPEPERDFAPPPVLAPEFDGEPLESPIPAEGMTPPREPVGPETVEYDVEQEHAQAAETEHAESAESAESADNERAEDSEKEPGEDVLEETPEFLQDTPDHDRLWFEQRPPKDFDFEG